MSKKFINTPKQDGFRMPAEYEPQDRVWMIWPERPDNWRNGGKEVQDTFVNLAKTISKYTPVTVGVSNEQYINCRNHLPFDIRVVEISNNDAWARDTGPTFVINDKQEIRGVDWKFNAWGGLYDGLYFPWDKDEQVARKICEIEKLDFYSTPDFVMEGGAFHVDGEGTVLTTEMCLLSPGRNPHMNKSEIEEMLCEFLNCEKVLWIKDGIDPEETTGHIDDVACFVRPGEVACIYTEDKNSPFYDVAQASYQELQTMKDAKGRKLKVHKLCCPVNNVEIEEGFKIDSAKDTKPREAGEICIASYMNYLITNNAVIVPQYGDENDSLAIEQLKEIYPDKDVVGVNTVEIVYGGGNIHCFTQQQPKASK